MNNTYQLYDEQGRPVSSGYVSKDDILTKGLLHGVAHVWIWRVQNGIVEVLIQKRSAQKMTWPGCYDVSAAGHLDAGEGPLAAGARETQEELGIALDESNLRCIGMQRAYLTTPDGKIENEFQWVYTVRVDGDTAFTIRDREVASLVWKPLEDMLRELQRTPELYVPHSKSYFDTLAAAIRTAHS